MLKPERLYIPFEQIVCQTCKKDRHALMWAKAKARWAPFVDSFNAATLTSRPAPLTFMEHKNIAKIFNGEREFLEYSWTIRSKHHSFLPLIKRKIVTIEIDEFRFCLKFHPKLKVAPLPVDEHAELLKDWALGYVQKAGENVGEVSGRSLKPFRQSVLLSYLICNLSGQKKRDSYG